METFSGCLWAEGQDYERMGHAVESRQHWETSLETSSEKLNNGKHSAAS